MQREALRLVFSDVRYITLSIAVFSGLFVFLCYMSQIIFFEPEFSFYVPQSESPDFILIVLVASLSGLVSSLSIYRICMLGEGVRRSGGGFFGTIIGAGAGACSCTSMGFAAASAFGAVGGTATAFLTQYEIPLRLVSIAILIYAYYGAVKDVSGKCKMASN